MLEGRVEGLTLHVAPNTSNVVPDLFTTLTAARDVPLLARTTQSTEIHEQTTKKSGLTSGGGFGFTIGTRKLIQEGTDTLAAAGSTVGSLCGGIAVSAQSIAIGDARDPATHDQETCFRQSGLTVALSAPGISSPQLGLQHCPRYSLGEGLQCESRSTMVPELPTSRSRSAPRWACWTWST
jgi:hypothetical protein